MNMGTTWGIATVAITFFSFDMKQAHHNKFRSHTVFVSIKFEKI